MCIRDRSMDKNAIKYEQLRQRLREEFMYYTGDGSERGTSLPMERRYVGKYGLTGYWADGTWWQGHYVALLATEYARLKREGKPTEATLKELRCAIEVYNRLDLNAEKFWKSDSIPQLNGFYLRDDIQRNDTTRMHLDAISSDYASNYNRPNATGNTPSQDQAWGSYIGFALAQKLVDDPKLHQEIAEISCRMVKGMQHVDSAGRTHWEIVNPVNGMMLQRESDIQWLQYAHAEIGTLLSAQNLHFGKSDRRRWRSMWHFVQNNMLMAKNGNFRWYGILAMTAILNDGGNGDCYAWLVKTCDKIVKKRPDLQQTLIFPHLPLINLVLYGKEGKDLVPRTLYDAYLDSAPADGAITKIIDGKSVRTPAPWNSGSLFCPWHNKDVGDANMIDFLLLYNLVELIYGE